MVEEGEPVTARQPPPDASATRVLPAPPERVWSVVTDLASIRARSPETFAARWVRGDGARPGARFRGWNRNGPYVWTTTGTVTEVVPGSTFAFAVTWLGLDVAQWRWDIEPEGDGSLVTLSTWDRRGRFMRILGTVSTGVRDRRRHNLEGIATTLERLSGAV
jgi:uncharacterized protein YndB with AHSA1/START domain